MSSHHCSKISKIQSPNLAGAIIEGLMPITAEPEAEDVDEDVPSRVRIFNTATERAN